MKYLEIVKIIDNIMDSDYKEFIKAMIYIEKNIKDELVLEKLYQEYYENEDMNLLNDFFYGRKVNKIVYYTAIYFK